MPFRYIILYASTKIYITRFSSDDTIVFKNSLPQTIKSDLLESKDLQTIKTM